MRFIGMVVVVCCAVLTGCDVCDDPNGCGALGQTCRKFPAPNPCDTGLRCVGETCAACGGLDEVCCWTAVGPDECTAAGTVCDESKDATPTCTDDCGLIGKACCGNTCPDPAGAVCNEATGMCEANAGNPAACGSGPLHFVELVDQFGCVQNEFIFNSSSPDDCVAAALAQLGPGWTAGPLDTPPSNCADKCQYWDDMPDASTGADPVHACAMSQGALDSCFNSLCTDCLYTDEPPNTCGNMF